MKECDCNDIAHVSHNYFWIIFFFIFQYNIRSYPTTILYNNSLPHQFTGHHTAADLVEFIEVSFITRRTILSLQQT